MKHLTDSTLKSLKLPAAGRIEIADTRCAGLAFRVTSTGAKSWTFRFRDPRSGKTTRIGVGPYPAVSLEAARKRATELQGVVAGGTNPVAAKRRERVGAPLRTFSVLAERYMAEHADRKKRSAPEDRRNLDLHILPKWKSRPYDELTRGDLVELVEGLIAAGKPTLANRVHALCSTIGNFAVDAGLLNGNPFARVAKRGVETVGRRVLSDDEIKLFWPAIVLPPVTRRVGLALRLALLTGARASEVAGMMRSELQHLDAAAQAAWIIPQERVKNGRAHFVPLAPLTVETVRAALELVAPGDEHVFRSPRGDGAKPIEGHALAVAMRRWCEIQKGKLKADPPSPHDLRRTLRTRLSALGVRREDCDAVMNHTPAGVGSKHYDLYDRAREKRQALEQWASHVAAIVR